MIYCVPQVYPLPFTTSRIAVRKPRHSADFSTEQSKTNGYMAKQIVILSGHVCAGKSTLAANLAKKYYFHHVKTWSFVQARGHDLSLDRTTLQDFGQKLDDKTKGAWLRDDLQKVERQLDGDNLIVVDSVRHPGQIEALRKAYGRRIVHVHLKADRPELERRYNERLKGKTDIKELTTYAQVLQNRTEAAVGEL